jgi:hypothetical protein
MIWNNFGIYQSDWSALVSVLYIETLQHEIPPSYKGQLVKYSYKITIGTQRVNSPIKLLRIPLRILVIDGKSSMFQSSCLKNFSMKFRCILRHKSFWVHWSEKWFTSFPFTGFPEVSACEDSIDLSPSNPFLDICEKDKELDPALQVLQVRSQNNSENKFWNQCSIDAEWKMFLEYNC